MMLLKDLFLLIMTKETDLTKYAVYQLLKTLKEGETRIKAFTLVKASKQ